MRTAMISGGVNERTVADDLEERVENFRSAKTVDSGSTVTREMSSPATAAALRAYVKSRRIVCCIGLLVSQCCYFLFSNKDLFSSTRIG